MKIAIEQSSFSKEQWITYCEKNLIEYKLIDAFANDAISHIKDCDALMWRYDLLQIRDNLVAKRLLSAVEQSGIPCFPSICENWHYDDKVAQKYLLEAIDAPLVTSYVFYDKEEAKMWAKTTDYPKVFKLRGGAGSSNVSLVRSKKETLKVIKKAFGRGFPAYSKWRPVQESFKKFIRGEHSFISFTKRFYRYFFPIYTGFIDYKEKNYVYFQEFIPNNNADIRLVVLNQNFIFGKRRFNRENDFRASGSGQYEFLTPNNIDQETLKIALEVAQQLNMNAIAYDIVYNGQNRPLIIELTYSFGCSGCENNPGYWDEDLHWHAGGIGEYMDRVMDGFMDRIKANRIN